MLQSKKLTNDIHQFQIPKSIVLFGRFLQFISNNLVTKYCAKILATPLHFKVPEREEMMQKSAKITNVNIASLQKEVAIYEYGYSKQKVLLVHGWSGRGTQFYQLADKILEHKMMVISFDAPGHGLSKKNSCDFNDYIETIHYLNMKYGPFHAVIGHSFGGMAISYAVSINKLVANKLILIGTENSTYDITKAFIQKMKLPLKITDFLRDYYKDLYHIDTKEHTVENAAKKIDNPTLVVHDSDDKFVPVSSAFVIRQSLKHGVLLITNGLGHHKIFKNSKIIQKMINFIQ